MLPFKNVGIFGEYEEKHAKEMQNLVLQLSIQRYVDALGDYPDHDDPANKLLLDMYFDLVMKQLNQIKGEGDDYPDA
tara:strand:+ start:378 stop:608 length:231 start_codon:yes stop_codon:yes gene_type:complete